MSLKCSASGSPLPQIRWYLYGRPISESIQKKKLRTGDFVDSNGDIISHLNISNVNNEDGGLFSCEASNDAGSINHAAPVWIIGLPYVHKIKNITIISGEKSSIDCPYSGYPIEFIDWAKGDLYTRTVGSQ